MPGLFPQDIEQQALQVINICSKIGLKLVTAESCTGGLIAACLTEIPGSSAVVERGFVTYSNAAKIQAIDVDEALIAQYGAVSAEVAGAMAVGALGASHADIAIAVTGIAGPGGGSPEKPVGLVYLAIASRGEEPEIRRCLFENRERRDVRITTVDTALAMLMTRISR